MASVMSEEQVRGLRFTREFIASRVEVQHIFGIKHQKQHGRQKTIAKIVAGTSPHAVGQKAAPDTRMWAYRPVSSSMLIRGSILPRFEPRMELRVQGRERMLTGETVRPATICDVLPL